MRFQKHKTKLFIGLIALLHIVGLIGLNLPEMRASVNMLTPVNLTLSTLIVLYFHKEWTTRLSVVFLIIAVFGFSIEVVGVKTSLVFGSYSYGNILGIKFLEVPLVLGILWLLMVYGSYDLAKRIHGNLWISSFIGASFMTIFDLFLEPVAINLGYWNWAGSEVPLQNYLAWFVISLLLHLLMNHNSRFSKNPLASATFLIQLLFFIVLNVSLK